MHKALFRHYCTTVAPLLHRSSGDCGTGGVDGTGLPGTQALRPFDGAQDRLRSGQASPAKLEPIPRFE